MHENAGHPINAMHNPNLAFSRRTALRLGAAGAALVAGLSSARRASGDCTLNPSQTQGPFWVDERLERSDIRPDPTSGVAQAGLPLRLCINVSELTAGACTPINDTWVDIWHCNTVGVYSDASGGGNPNTIGQRWLRGYQRTDAHGNARFITVYPGWYMGRTVHIHFRIRKFSGTTTTFNFVSQLYFSDPVSNAIFARAAPYNTHLNRSPASNTADALYSAAMLLTLADNGDHATASFNAVVNSDGIAMRTGAPGLTPWDPEAEEHADDFGGGTPPPRPG